MLHHERKKHRWLTDTIIAQSTQISKLKDQLHASCSINNQLLEELVRVTSELTVLQFKIEFEPIPTLHNPTQPNQGQPPR